MRFIAITFVAMAAISAAPVWAQYKCTDPATGQVSFQQQPCSGPQRQQALELKTVPPPAAGMPAPDFGRKNAELDKRLAIRTAIEEGRPMVGMTASELQMTMGTASTVNRTQSGDTISDQHVYPRGGRTVYVYVKGGVVTTIQDTSSGQSTAAVAGKCLSKRELWNLEVEASRSEIRDNEPVQARYRQRIALAKDCS
jgi:hypothetical protein